MYQSRFGLSREERLLTNQGCRSDVWLIAAAIRQLGQERDKLAQINPA